MLSAPFRKDLKKTLYRRFRLVILRGQVVLDMDRLQALTTRDSIRVCSLYAAAREIHENSVDGSAAELGVYQGHFAKDIHAAFPDRRLFLFDTFEGFHKSDKDVEMAGSFSTGSEDFSDTSVDTVMKKMARPEQVAIRAGYFPESIQEADRAETFAFVSIDADLYQPIYEGLRFFYPRLSRGGYIFVHDYNNADYPGVKAAVRKYCAEAGAGFVPLVDPCGTAIIAKG